MTDDEETPARWDENLWELPAAFEEGRRQAMTEDVRIRGRYSDTHWGALTNQASLAGWVEARQMGLSADQCDKIVEAAVRAVRELQETWADQEQGEQ